MRYKGFKKHLYLRVEVLNTDKISNIKTTDRHMHHVCMVWSGSDGGIWKAYKNGKIMISGSGLRPRAFVDGGGRLIIGQDLNRRREGNGTFNCNAFGRQYGFGGSISSVYLWKTSLDSKEIIDLYRQCRVPRTSELLTHWNVKNLSLTRGARIRPYCRMV